MTLSRFLIKVSQPPFLNQSLKWQLPGRRFWFGGVIPRKYVLPKMGNSTDSSNRLAMGTSKEVKSGVGWLLTKMILCVVKKA